MFRVKRFDVISLLGPILIASRRIQFFAPDKHFVIIAIPIFAENQNLEKEVLGQNERSVKIKIFDSTQLDEKSNTANGDLIIFPAIAVSVSPVFQALDSHVEPLLALSAPVQDARSRSHTQASPKILNVALPKT